MTATLAHIWRHPIKGIGSEALTEVALTPDEAVVGDRAFAMLNGLGEDTDAWQPRRNFVQVASGPRLAAVGAVSTSDGVMLTHPDRDPVEIKTSDGSETLSNWVGNLWPAEQRPPVRLVKAPTQGMTDVPYPSVSIGNLASLRALSQKAGMEIDMRRFRINLWLDGLAPWEEIDLLDRPTLTIGDALMAPEEPIERCRAPDANPRSGARDVSILQQLRDGWDTRNFGIYVKVQQAGTIRVGDALV